MTILLIDDDKDDQILFCETVRIISPQIHCDIAGNGKEGLQVLNEASKLPELVFLDINMPIMDGRETLKVIKSTPKLQRLNVIVYSTSIGPADAQEYTKLGVKHITKPSTFNGLLRALTGPIEQAIRQTQSEINSPFK
ncbi:MAG TPA: response regulator [Chryseosolibacter sp.]|nr:response regulator [Chryseosolibacter sp.]